MDANITGLSAREVTERRERGEGGAAAERITKSRAQIVRENVFTLFNLLNFIIARFCLRWALTPICCFLQ